MVLQMLNFIKFLGLIIVILILFGIIFTIIDAIYSNIKLSIAKREALKKIKLEIQKMDLDNLVIEKISKEDVE